MQLFDNKKKLVIVYLSRSGCLEYTKEMIKGSAQLDPLLVIPPFHTETFGSLDYKIVATADTLVPLLWNTITIKKKINKILTELKSQYGTLELFLPAFHPWNSYFLRWARANATSATTTIHDYKTHKGERSTTIEIIQKKHITLASRVLFLSDYVRQQAVAELGPSEKYIVSPHPLLDAKTINTLPHSSSPKVLFLGRCLPYKGIDLLVEAIQGLNIQQLTMAGAQNGIHISDSEKIKVINRILTEEEISQLLASHEILVLPYKEASQSGILTLGISARMVMLITKVGGLPEQLPENAALWVEPSVEQLRKGLHQLISESSTYESIKRAVVDYKKS